MDNYQLNEGILDTKCVMRLRSSVGWHNLSEPTLTAALQQSLFFASISVDDKAIAMGRVVGDGYQYFYLQDIIVSPEHQGQGLGYKIVENLVGRVKAVVEPGAFFGLMSAANITPLYEKFGFKIRSSQTPGMGMYIDHESAL